MLDIRELGRRPGSTKSVTRSVAAPAGLGIDVISVAEGSQIHLDLTLEVLVDGVFLSGVATVTLAGECTRCLDSISEVMDVNLQQLYVRDAVDDEEDGVARFEDDLIDLEPILREAVVLALPFQPVCREDCPGLCVECGARLADDPDHQHEDAIDPRWSALSGLARDLGATGTNEE